MQILDWKIDGMHCGGCAQTLQALLARLPGVRRVEVSWPDGHARWCRASALGRPVTPEEVAAVVVPVDGGVALDTDDLAAHCAATLAPYKVPTVWVVRREPLPRNAAGKVLKRELSA